MTYIVTNLPNEYAFQNSSGIGPDILLLSKYNIPYQNYKKNKIEQLKKCVFVPKFL